MPIYEYVCEKCHNELEAIQKFSDAPLTNCPSCKSDALVKKTSAPAFHLKGGGWYKDGYSNGSSDDSSKSKPASTSSSSKESKGSDDSSKGSTSKETTSKAKEASPKSKAS